MAGATGAARQALLAFTDAVQRRIDHGALSGAEGHPMIAAANSLAGQF